MAYGLSASADGNYSPWVFNPPATYWDGASAFVKARRRSRRQLRQAQGQTIGLVHLDVPYGKDRSRYEALAKDYGFTLKLYPVPGPRSQNQTSLSRLEGGATGPTGFTCKAGAPRIRRPSKEASKIGFPMNRLVGVLVGGWRGRCASRRRAGQRPSVASAPRRRKYRSSRRQGRYARPRKWRWRNYARQLHADESVQQHASSAGAAIAVEADAADFEAWRSWEQGREGKLIAHPIVSRRSAKLRRPCSDHTFRGQRFQRGHCSEK